jgi:DinB superfamily
MQAIELIRWAMQLTDAGTANLVADLREHPLTCSTPGGKAGEGNHAIWLLGHLAFIEGQIPRSLFGEPNPVEHWASLFAPGTQPQADAKVYPSFDEVLNTYRDLRKRNLKLLDEIGEGGLDRVPKSPPPGFEELMKTFGHTFLLITLHNMVHYGEIADARRVAGYKPLM